MEQKFEGTPQATIQLDGRRLTRTDVTGDWGSRLQWEIRRDGQVVATPPARAELTYEHADATPGEYQVVLQMWKYVNYKKDGEGNFTESKFVDISSPVTYRV